MTAITRIHALNLTFGALLACASTASAIAQQDVANQPFFKAHGQVHAAPSDRPLQSTAYAPINPAIQPMHAQAGAVPKHVPGQAKPHGPLVMQRNGPSYGATPITGRRPPPPVYKAAKRTPHAPTGPGPLHANAGAASDKHSIIFVGGHQHTVQPGSKQSLNPQPIPPGHQTVSSLHPIGPRPASVVKPKTHGSEPH